jgi:hypothetical protein
MSDDVIDKVRSYVNAGGKLFLSFDAGTFTPEGFYAPGKSRLGDLAGVDYAFYDELKGDVTQFDAVWGTPVTVKALALPPGKYLPLILDDKAGAAPQKGDPNKLAIAGYYRNHLDYPGYVTRGKYAGKVLLSSQHGLVAGVSKFGKGEVLFVNLPLGYLKGQTDGLLLHTFLRYFGETVLQFPRTAAVPEGVGGIVMNWHVDSNADIKYILTEMNKLGIYEQGPYSIHITAGPDTRQIGDGLGVNVPKNELVRQWLRETSASGHSIGSHGGWIHDYFGKNLNSTQTNQFTEFLDLNKKALEDVIQKPVTEYSAPQGNQPEWVTHWLAEHGVLGFYFTGNTGSAPTRAYREGVQEEATKHMWAFPVTNLGETGSFEEMQRNNFSVATVSSWLRDVTDYTSEQRSSRLIYFHPNGTRYYPDAMRAWLTHAAARQKEGRYRWYTMTQLSRFLNSREKMTWSIGEEVPGTQRFLARHDETLAQQTWVLPTSRYAKPRILKGIAKVSRSGADWLVVAGDGKELQFESKSK